ncbi:MAG: patatin-like phospholipase family protein [Pseudomonadota bacterium]
MDPDKIEYLALEGGGGKGAAYLGAIEALEKDLGSANRRVLPAWKRDERTNKKVNRIKGISGASAGALTALLLALGLSAQDIRKLLSDTKALRALYDPMSPGMVRAVAKNRFKLMPHPNLLPYVRKPSSVADQLLGSHFTRSAERELIAKAIKQRPAKSKTRFMLLTALFDAYRVYLRYQSKKDSLGIYMQKQRSTPTLYSLFYDGGLFTGAAMRAYIVDRIFDFLKTDLYSKGFSAKVIRDYASRISFKELKGRTGVDLVVTACNISTRRPAYFSAATTEDFPVADGVAISMSFPGAFKPVWIQGTDKVSDGFWADGGILNNLPIHAFDSSPTGTLNPLVLALRLDETGKKPKYLTDPVGVYGRSVGAMDLFDEIGRTVGAVFETLMYPGEEGQLRTSDEKKQTVELPTRGVFRRTDNWALSTLDFVAPQDVVNESIIASRKKVNEFFIAKQRP